jgi:ribosomal protein S18 acetylase RimI-like enzyme
MIRKAVLADAPQQANLHVSSWRHAYHSFISHAFLYATLTVDKREAAFAEAIRDSTEETYVFEEDSIVKGLLTIGECRDDDKTADTFELWGIYVDPRFMRQGIGRRLVAFCEAEARARGKMEIVLWAFEKNTDAALFYRKLGFIPDGMKKLLEFFSEYEIRFLKQL